jgi:hypothetical protein
MARQGGQVQLEQSDMRLAWYMAKMAKEEFSHAVMEETQQLFKKPSTEVQEEKKQGVEFPRHNKAKDAIETHTAMVLEYQTNGCLPCHNGTSKNPQTSWRHKGTGAPPPQWAPPWPGTLPAPSEDEQSSQTEGVTPGYVYIHTPFPSARFFVVHPYAKHRMHY